MYDSASLFAASEWICTNIHAGSFERLLIRAASAKEILYLRVRIKTSVSRDVSCMFIAKLSPFRKGAVNFKEARRERERPFEALKPARGRRYAHNVNTRLFLSTPGALSNCGHKTGAVRRV